MVESLSSECCMRACLVVYDCLWPHGPWPHGAPTRLLHPWDSPGKKGRLPRPPPGHIPNPGIEPASPTSPVLAGRFFTTDAAWEACVECIDLLLSIQLSIHGWTFWFVSTFCLLKIIIMVCLFICFTLDSHFSWVCTEELHGWVMWSLCVQPLRNSQTVFPSCQNILHSTSCRWESQFFCLQCLFLALISFATHQNVGRENSHLKNRRS